MKITFIYPDLLLHRHDWTGYFYVGLASLAAVLRQQGHETDLIHITRPIGQEELIEKLRKAAPDLIGLSVTSHMFSFVREYAAWIHQAGLKAPVICGGIHPTIAPDETLALPGIDIICRGEGETALAELCRRLEGGQNYTDIPNLWLKRDGHMIRNPIGPLVEDLDSLPFPDRSIFEYPNLYGERLGRGSFMVSRGCPYSCSYCCNHLRRQIYQNMRHGLRFRTPGNVIGEIKQVLRQYPFINSLIFDDDILFMQKEWTETFAAAFSSEIGLPFTCNARANLVDARIAELLRQAGCRHVKFGIESGSERICNEILNRRLTNDQVKQAFRFCQEAGLVTESFNMVGIPTETPREVLETIKLNAAIKVSKMQVSIYQPYQGTRLAELCREKGYWQGDTDLGSDFFSPSTVTLDTISPGQTLMFRDYFKVLVRGYQFLGAMPRILSRLLVSLTDSLLQSKLAAGILNGLYIPANYVFRKLQYLMIKSHSRKTKRNLHLSKRFHHLVPRTISK